MGYRVEIVTIESNIFGKIKYQKLAEGLLKVLNDLDSRGYDVISVIQLGSDSKDFDYQIISKKRKEA